MGPDIVIDSKTVAAILACLSANSFSSMPVYSGTHMRVIYLFLNNVLFNLFSIFIAMSTGLNWIFMLLSVPRESLNIIWMGGLIDYDCFDRLKSRYCES